MYGCINFGHELFEAQLFTDPGGYSFVKEIYDKVRLIRQFVAELDKNKEIWTPGNIRNSISQ